MKKSKSRQKRGTGGLIYRKGGKKEGRYRVYRQNGTYIEKSFTRNTECEINDIKAKLRLLGIIENDVNNIKIDKHTNEIILEKNQPLVSKQKVKLDKNILVEDYVDYWLWTYRRKGMKGKRIKDSTFEDYVQKCMYIKKDIGTIKLKNDEIRKLEVSELTFDYIEEQLLNLHSQVAHSTAVQIRNHIYSLMKCAKKDGIIEENPFEYDEINFPEAEKKERIIIREDEVEKVIEHCINQWNIDVLTQLFTGARAGEIRGLKWEDFDESFMKILMLHKEVQNTLAQKLGYEFKDSDAVFTTSTYTPFGRNDVNDKVKKVVKELQITNYDEITSHFLRHGFCYAGLLNDVPLEYMQLFLGHANISVTREWYAHFDKSKINYYAKKVNTNRMMKLKKFETKNGIAI